MQGLIPSTPTKGAEASIPTKNVKDGPNEILKGTFKIPRKASKCTLPWDLKAEELNHLSPPQYEKMRARKKPRLEEPFSKSTGEAAKKISSLDTAVSLPPPDDDDHHHHHHYADSDPMTDTQPNARATAAFRRWTTHEDTRLNKAVLVRTRDGKRQSWDAIAALVPGRTKTQCQSRWYDSFDPRIVRTTTYMDKWTPDEDDKLKDAVQMHNGKNWFAIATLVPARTKKQCRRRWRDALDPRIHRETAREGRWTPDEDDKLKNAVQMYNGKNWEAIFRLVSGRTINQCRMRWQGALNPSIDWSGRTDKWTSDEDDKLKDAVQIHGVRKDWFEIAALVPGRTKQQCGNRWKKYLEPINRSTVRE
jgi:hypothetical protein